MKYILIGTVVLASCGPTTPGESDVHCQRLIAEDPSILISVGAEFGGHLRNIGEAAKAYRETERGAGRPINDPIEDLYTVYRYDAEFDTTPEGCRVTFVTRKEYDGRVLDGRPISLLVVPGHPAIFAGDR